MATTYITTHTTGPGTTLSLVSNFDNALIAEGIVLGSTTYTALFGAFSNHRVTVLGTVDGFTFGVFLGDDPTLDSGQRVVVGASGVVSAGNFAMVLYGFNSSVTNHGLISAGSSGVFAQGTSAIGQSALRIFNDGTIEGGDYGIYVHRTSTEALRIENHGTIRGGAYSLNLEGTATNDIVLNRGALIGDVWLGGGNDRYDGRRGSIDGVVFGGDGADTFIAGLSEEVFEGGAGLDLLDFSARSSITLSLANDIAGTGTAAGDTYLEIENVTGSTFGNDRITGDAAANRLRGQGGADSLAGGAGADMLFGGAGIDTLSGGAGADRFHFSSLAESGDRISDFGAGAGNDDRLTLVAAGFGGGLVAGPLAAGRFITRADNLAQDADDRFIFRTTDRTLWFDGNGNAAGGPSLIADLQAAALVTAADIFLL